LVCQAGADELSVLLPETSGEGALAWTTALLAASTSANFVFAANAIKVTLSGGVASMGEGEATSLAALTSLAEKRLARSRGAGGSMVTSS